LIDPQLTPENYQSLEGRRILFSDIVALVWTPARAAQHVRNQCDWRII
jgi:hypothetical protein